MKFNMTDEHYSVLNNVMNVMQAFYANDMRPIFEDIGKANNVSSSNIEEAIRIVESYKATAGVGEIILFIECIKPAVLGARDIDKKNPNPQKDERYTHMVELDDNERAMLSHILDVYSRLHNGQFEKIFEELDIPAGNLNIERVEELQDLKWNGKECLKARNLLVPACENISWMSHIGIEGENSTHQAKITYEMSRVLAYPDDFTGFVSGCSMMLGED